MAFREAIAEFPEAIAELAFPNTEGNRDLRWAEKTFPAAIADAKIEDFRLHDTRHTFASRLAMEGVDDPRQVDASALRIEVLLPITVLR